MKIRFRGNTVTVYRKSKNFPYYRITYRADGKTVTTTFKTYAEAKKTAETKVRELYSGNHVGASLPKAAADAYRNVVTKLDQLGCDMTAAGDPAAPPLVFRLEDAIAEFIEAKRALGTRRLVDAVNGFLGTVAQVRRVKVRAAVDEYQLDRKGKTIAKVEDKRPELSPKAHYQDELRLTRFAGALPMDVCDLTKDHLDLFFQQHLAGLSAKSLNHYRGTLRQWLTFCVERDYLPAAHRLLEARSMKNGKADGGDVEIYTAKELAALLDHADETLRPVLVIGALAGLRTQELLRLDWSDVWRRPGYIEITAQKAKTRSRRLVPIVASLAAWLEPHRHRKEGRVWDGKENYFHQLFREAGEAAGVARKDNALRHSFISHRIAENQNEHQVAAEAGTSVTMLHRHYREIVTAAEAKEWFSVLPAGAAQNVIVAPARQEGVA